MSIYTKIRRMLGAESYEEKLYKLLNVDRYKNRPYETIDLGEGMAVIQQTIWEWWKPRFLLNHQTKCAYEFMDGNEYLVTVSYEDIDWDSIEKLPEKAQQRARSLSFRFPSFIHRFENGVAEVSWQLNPDGRYYMDDDGFGMTDDVEITVFGFIDTTGQVVVKFRTIEEIRDLIEMRKQAENIVNKKD